MNQWASKMLRPKKPMTEIYMWYCIFPNDVFHPNPEFSWIFMNFLFNLLGFSWIFLNFHGFHGSHRENRENFKNK